MLILIRDEHLIQNQRVAAGAATNINRMWPLGYAYFVGLISPPKANPYRRLSQREYGVYAMPAKEPWAELESSGPDTKLNSRTSASFPLRQ